MGKKPTILTLKDKSDIIEQFRKGASVTNLSRKYDVAKSTICAINKKSKGILNAVNNTFMGPGNRRTLKSSGYPKMEKILYGWFLRQRDKNIPVSGDMLKEKAKLIHSAIKENESTFHGSDGWLQRFKVRFGVRLLKITGEKLSSQPELVEPFKIKLQAKLIELDLSVNQIYNADETGLYWKLLPEKTFVSSLERNAPGRKSEKQRITFLACTNANGLHKLRPLIIGKAKNPRSFKNFNCPVDYKHSKTAWMTAAIFKDWFHKSFVPQVRTFSKNQGLPVKALLLLDNAPSHPPENELKSDDGCIVTMFMPPNVTPLIQPMDQNVIRITKLYYRTSLLASIVADGHDVSESLKKLNLKDAILCLTAAWERLEQSTIAKCWKNILNFVEDKEDSDDDVPLSILRSQWNAEITSAIEQTIEILHTIYPQDTCTVAEVNLWNADMQIEINDENIENSDTDSDIDIIPEPKEKIRPKEAVEIFNKALQWADEDGVNLNETIVLRNLRDRAVLRSLETKKRQTRITDFFP